MISKRRHEGTYAREVERCLERISQRPVVLSPRDWGVIAGWHARGIPLPLILETMEVLARRKKRGRPPSSVAYFVRAVEESWQAVQEGRAVHLTGTADRPKVNQSDLVRPWADALRSGELPEALSREVSNLVARVVAGDDPAEVDAELDSMLLRGNVAEDAFQNARQEALAALEPYKRRMLRTVWEATLERAISDRMRTVLGLHRLRGR